MNNIVANPFTAPASAQQGGALAETVSARETSEVQAMMVVAKKFPRDQVQAMDRILQACTRPSLAEGAVYSYSRGGSDVSGPSIRLAETIAQTWGNMQFGFRELSRGVDSTGAGYSEVEAYAWDIENNTRKPIHFRVRHWRDTRKGGYALTDERDIYELVANMASRRVRNCILAVIPGDVVEAAQKQCETTLSASADTSPDAIKRMLTAFEQFGVQKAHIEKLIQRRLDSIQPAAMVRLKKIYASLRDGMSMPDEWFDMEATAEADRLAEAISKGVDPSTGEVKRQSKLRQEKQQQPEPPPVDFIDDDIPQ